MKCKNCLNLGIENYADGNLFYYCRTCKEEIFEEKINSSPDIIILGNDICWELTKTTAELEEYNQQQQGLAAWLPAKGSTHFNVKRDFEDKEYD